MQLSNLITMRINLLCFITSFIIINWPAFSQIEIPFEQTVRRDDVSIFQAFQGTKGVLKLGRDSVVFRAIKASASQINFALPYTQIAKVKRYKATLFSNRIGITTLDRKTYRIFTYRRKKILKLLKSRTAVLR